MGIAPDEEPPTNADWAKGVMRGWVKRIPQVAVTINHHLKLGNGKTRAEMHFCRKLGFGAPVFYSKPSDCLEVVNILDTTKAKRLDLTLLNQRAQRSRSKREETLHKPLRHSEITAPLKRGEFVLRVRDKSRRKYTSYFKTMIFIVSDANKIAVAAQRIDGRREYVSEWTDTRLFQRITLTRTAVAVFLQAVGAID